MAGFTKLFGSLVDSTVWRESKETKIVWITMLAKCDRYGIVEASLPGLADAARVTLDECKEALKVLMEADEYSRSREFGGRRVREVDGGWEILNYGKYRAKLSEDDRREYQASWMKEYRKRKKTGEKREANTGRRDAAVQAIGEGLAEARENVPQTNHERKSLSTLSVGSEGSGRVLPGVQEPENEVVAADASVDERAAPEGQRAPDSEHLSGAREAGAEAVREVREPGEPKAPPGLREAARSDLAVPVVPPVAAPDDGGLGAIPEISSIPGIKFTRPD